MPVVSEAVSKFFSESPDQRHVAVMFRGKIYVGCPRHMDAINLAFAGMTQMQKHRVYLRIADGKETMLFGTALGDGTEWEHDEKWQASRMQMYGLD